MQAYGYVLFLLVSLGGLLFADYRYKAALFADRRFYGALLACCVGFFLVWDIAGIVLGVFSTNPQWVSGLYIFTPNMPVEELLFLTLLSEVTILAWRLPQCLPTRS